VIGRLVGSARSLLALVLLIGGASCSRCDAREKAALNVDPPPTPKLAASLVAPEASEARTPPLREPDVFVLHVVDVGTGLAVFIEGPDFSMVYDGGSNDDLRDERSNRLTAYLRTVRPDLRKVDHVVLSHAHRDHVELLADVLNEYDVREVWEPGVLAKVCAYQRFVQAVAAHPGTKYHTATQTTGTHEVIFPKTSCRVPSEFSVTHSSTLVEGAVVRLGQNATMTFLHVDGERRENLNENSLVVRLALGDRTLLLMGDAEAGKRSTADSIPLPESTEGQLLARHAKELRSDVLLVGHHGSKTSTRRVFLNAVSPALSIVSGGPHAYSGHTLPDAEVVDLLAQRGPVLRTDLDDVACATSTAKIGRDADGRPGGCDNIRVTFRRGEAPRGEYWRGHD
jgi:competence protein ComEC